jgi:ABC-type transporter Mla MlaB component
MMSKDAIYDDGVLRVTWAGSPPVLALAGEIDESTYPGLVGALKEAADGEEEIHVSLAKVEYCDLAGLRAIILLTGTDSYSHNGDTPPRSRRVVLHEVPSQLRTVLRIVGWDSVPGLALDGPGAGLRPRPDGRAEAGLRSGRSG